jgi:hypothetical protein
MLFVRDRLRLCGCQLERRSARAPPKDYLCALARIKVVPGKGPERELRGGPEHEPHVEAKRDPSADAAEMAVI